MDDNIEGVSYHEGCLDDNEDVTYVQSLLQGMGFDSEKDFVNVDPSLLTAELVMTFHFSNLEMAYKFYNWYGRILGFSARKGKVRKNKDFEIVEKTFFCHREGKRKKKEEEEHEEQEEEAQTTRESRPETRTGCHAKMKVRLDGISGRWRVSKFVGVHNHDLLDKIHSSMLPAHRKMTDADIMQINNLRMVGISTPHIYGTFATQSGGFQHVGFSKRDIYNEIGRQRVMQVSDVKGAFQYLRDRGSAEGPIFWSHTLDSEGRLMRLFWCDGHSQIDYKVFGDVLAFDATYKKNKYHFPLVVFSGINHHNQTTIFANAVIADETEETYVWLLEQLMVAMKGKTPLSVITDGDLAMKNAIKRVFPNAHHRLCAWHLLRNANTNVKNLRFLAVFKKCMLGDYEIYEFQHRWVKVVTECGLEENTWVKDLYERRSMWATCYIRGTFFTGIRTTSRCEGLHAQLGRFVHSRHGLVDFLQNFHHCLEYFRYKEIEADYASLVGQPVLQTNLHALERSASRLFKREIFKLFRPALAKGSTVRVKSCTQLMSQTIYTVSKYGRSNKEWRVSHLAHPLQFRCCCKRMESFGLPCEHIVGVMVHLNMDEIPGCLVLDRWTMAVKENLYQLCDKRTSMWDSIFMARCGCLDALSRKVNRLASRSTFKFNSIRDLLTEQLKRMEITDESNNGGDGENCNEVSHGCVRDPNKVGSKGCAGPSSMSGPQRKRRQRCGICGGVGHNRKTCPMNNSVDHVMMSQQGSNLHHDDADNNFNEPFGLDEYDAYGF